ncbi:MAG: hypothetical protein AWU57_192 [Marinobacter sp. T13-3]|nr:MAG: hypothetical protein AWU57_192 [Marinobacter sp. T13-3]
MLSPDNPALRNAWSDRELNLQRADALAVVETQLKALDQQARQSDERSGIATGTGQSADTITIAGEILATYSDSLRTAQQYTDDQAASMADTERLSM